MLEDEVESLQGKIILLDELKSETAQLKAQVDSLTTVSFVLLHDVLNTGHIV